MNAIGGPSSTGRRAFMIVAASTALGLAGCTTHHQSDARTDQSPPATPATPSPTPLPGTVAAVQRENELAAFAAAALDRFRGDLSTADRNLLSRLRDAHLAHAAVLATQDPTVVLPSAGPDQTPTPAPTASVSPSALGHGPKSARAKLRALELEAARAYAASAAAPGGPGDRLGSLALLWGSLATASTCYADACGSGRNPSSVLLGDQRANVALPDPQTVTRNLLGQCYAMIFGYQNALAYLSEEDAEQARSTLAGYRDLRDLLADQLSSDQARAPGPHAAYRLPVQPTSRATAARLIGIMETRLLPYVGQWLATAGDDRRVALKTMIETARDALTWWPKIIVWPGYPAA